MVATDTLVGIVGAVVLVAAMAGVFVYEYNNTPDTGGALDDRFSHLSADGDIDGDGLRNADDGDIDGDGIDNADDEETVVTETMAGSLGPRMEPAASPSGGLDSTAEEGIKAIRVTVNVAPTAADPSGTLSGFQVTVTLEDGTQLGTASGDSVLEVASTEIMAGGFSVTVQPSQGSFGGDYDLSVELIY